MWFTESFTPRNEAELTTELEKYNPEEAIKQKEAIWEDAKQELIDLYESSFLWIISRYIIKNNIDINHINTKCAEISFDWNNYINTNIPNLSIDKIKNNLKDTFVEEYFETNHESKEISSYFADVFKWLFSDKALERKEDFDNNIEEFRKFLIENDKENEVYYNLFSLSELNSLWKSIQYLLVSKHNMHDILENEWGIEWMLKKVHIEWSNWKSLAENWNEANGLLKWWAWIAWIFLAYKTITWLWNHNDNPLKGKFWKTIWVWLLWELAWQVYTWRSFLWEWLWEIGRFIWWESNIKDLKSSYEKTHNNERKWTDDYTWLFLITLWEKKKDDVLWDFDFINESNNDAFIQSLIQTAKENWDWIEELKNKLKKWREKFLEKTLKDLDLGIDFSIEDLMDVIPWETLSDKISQLLERKEDLKDKNIIWAIISKTWVSDKKAISDTLKTEWYIETIKWYLKTGNLILNIDLSIFWKTWNIDIKI